MDGTLTFTIEQLAAVKLGYEDDFRRMVNGSIDLTDLDHAFLWQSTPQGHDYWNNLFRNMENITETDRQFLRELAMYATFCGGFIPPERSLSKAWDIEHARVPA